MPIDPAAPFELDPDQRRADRLAELERRVRALESGAPVFQPSAGAPTVAARDGTGAVDTAAARLWIRQAGAWRFVTLT